jgi:hypothetical protein
MKAGRNEPCPCGSGKKFKHCCEAKNRRRAATRDSLAKGLFYVIGPFAVVVAIAMVVSTLRGRSVGDDGLERVWSVEHGHWHAILPDGTETEVKPGMIWDPEHGHFHQAGAPADSARRYLTDDLTQRMRDAEAELDP